MKPNLDFIVRLVVVVLCLVTLALVAASTYQFTDTKLVYQGF